MEHASAPPPPMVLSMEEFEELQQGLVVGGSALPGPAELIHFRKFTTGRLLWVSQARILASGYNGGTNLLREAYERQLLVDPWNLGPSDGAWVQAMHVADPTHLASDAAATQAFVTM
eukprot:736503-Amphidinium_carterae.1